MAPRDKKAPIELPPEKRTEDPAQQQFLLQVDRQTKSGYQTMEAAEAAGLKIKRTFPKLQVAVYDAKEGKRKLIELPASDGGR